MDPILLGLIITFGALGLTSAAIGSYIESSHYKKQLNLKAIAFFLHRPYKSICEEYKYTSASQVEKIATKCIDDHFKEKDLEIETFKKIKRTL